MERRLAPPSAVYKQGHVELIQHRAHLPQIPDRTVYTLRTGRRHGEVGMGKGSFGREKQKLGKHQLSKGMNSGTKETLPESREGLRSDTVWKALLRFSFSWVSEKAKSIFP
jgi:hypothetical protein